jgi:YVTN family beta-propeller protein
MNLLAIVVAGALAVVPAPPVTGDQLYIANGGDDVGADANVARFGIGAGGLVTPAGTVANGLESSLVFTKDHRFAYAAADADHIDRYRVRPGGALTPAGQTPTSQPFGMAVDPHGPTLFVVNFNDGAASGALSAFHIGPGGALTLVNTVDTGVVHPKGVAVTPDGTAHGFAIGADGRLTEVASAASGLDPNDLAVGTDGQHVYVADTTANTVTVFAAGTLKPLQTIPPQGTGPNYQGVTVQSF